VFPTPGPFRAEPTVRRGAQRALAMRRSVPALVPQFYSRGVAAESSVAAGLRAKHSVDPPVAATPGLLETWRATCSRNAG